MSYLLDTCVVSDFFKKRPSVVTKMKSVSPKQLYISAVTVMEIEYGLSLKKEREKKIRPLFTSLLQCIQVLPFCHESAIQAAQIRATLQKKGTPIGPFDLLLAGSAIYYDCIFVTANVKEFARVENLTVENWLQ